MKKNLINDIIGYVKETVKCGRNETYNFFFVKNFVLDQHKNIKKNLKNHEVIEA